MKWLGLCPMTFELSCEVPIAQMSYKEIVNAPENSLGGERGAEPAHLGGVACLRGDREPRVEERTG